MSNKNDRNKATDLFNRSLTIPDIISELLVIPKTLENSFDEIKVINFSLTFLDDIKNFIPNELELDILSSINSKFLYYYIGKRR